MDLNWFPGHMTKAMRLIEDNIKNIDIVIYVLDSRAPLASINEHFTFIKDLPVVYALNKADLVSTDAVKEWVDILSTDKTAAVALDSTRSNSAYAIVAQAKKLLSQRLQKYKAKGLNYTIKAMVVGMPNTGKSTLINNLCGNRRAVTGNRPGVTKGKQWLKAGEYFDLLDTPGVLKPKLEDKRLAYHLAYVGSIKDDVVDIPELAASLLQELSIDYSKNLIERYKTEDFSLQAVGIKRGFLLRGGEVDLERTASAVIDDFRKGRLGKIILEKAAEYAGV